MKQDLVPRGDQQSNLIDSGRCKLRFGRCTDRLSPMTRKTTKAMAHEDIKDQ